LEDAEIDHLTAAFPFAKEYLSPEHLKAIEDYGLTEGAPGNRATVCVDEKACAFAYFENGIARCSFERAFLDGRTSWRKPLSCHLFPLRTRRSGVKVLHAEIIEECRPGWERGETEKTPLYRFLEEPLVRLYGRKWYDTFVDACERPDGKNQGSLQC
jgi:hypothetical protein